MLPLMWWHHFHRLFDAYEKILCQRLLATAIRFSIFPFLMITIKLIAPNMCGGIAGKHISRMMLKDEISSFLNFPFARVFYANFITFYGSFRSYFHLLFPLNIRPYVLVLKTCERVSRISIRLNSDYIKMFIPARKKVVERGMLGEFLRRICSESDNSLIRWALDRTIRISV